MNPEPAWRAHAIACACAPARALAACALLATASLLLAGCGRNDEPAPSGGKVYVAGLDAAYAPFEYQDEKGEIVGFSVELLRAVAAKDGFEVRFVNTPWEGIFNALAQGDRDLLISSITITDARRQSMDFSEPYFDAYQLIAVKAGSKVAKFEDLKALKVGVQTGTTGDEVASKLQGRNSANIRRFESTPLALEELQAGGVDAVVADNGVVVNFVAHNPNASFKTVADAAFAPERYGMAVRKGDKELLAKLNRGLAAVKADGSYARLMSRYFGTSAASPATTTSAATPAPSDAAASEAPAQSAASH